MFKKIFQTLAIAFCCLSTSSFGFASLDMQKADSLYELRASGFSPKDAYADSVPIHKAVVAYTALFNKAAATGNGLAAWKLMRALYFKAYYTTSTQNRRKALYDEAKRIGESALIEDGGNVNIYAWLVIVDGVRGQEYGILKSAYEGMANKIKGYAEKVIELDPAYDDGLGYRVLGRLHFLAPRLPILLPWPSKTQALIWLKKAYEVSPDNLYNCQYLAESLYQQGQKQRATEVAVNALHSSKTSDGFVEDTFTKRVLTALLNEWQK